MIPYQLATGKTIYISFDQWMDLDDDKIQEYIAKNAGVEIFDPFVDFYIPENRNIVSSPLNIEDVEPLPEEEVEAIKKEIKNEGRI